jgi:hypothetical protein
MRRSARTARAPSLTFSRQTDLLIRNQQVPGSSPGVGSDRSRSCALRVAAAERTPSECKRVTELTGCFVSLSGCGAAEGCGAVASRRCAHVALGPEPGPHRSCFLARA